MFWPKFYIQKLTVAAPVEDAFWLYNDFRRVLHVLLIEQKKSFRNKAAKRKIKRYIRKKNLRALKDKQWFPLCDWLEDIITWSVEICFFLLLVFCCVALGLGWVTFPSVWHVVHLPYALLVCSCSALLLLVFSRLIKTKKLHSNLVCKTWFFFLNAFLLLLNTSFSHPLSLPYLFRCITIKWERVSLW